MTDTALTCPYCEQDIDAGTSYDLIKMRRLADHKARCPKKRYLGGALTTDNHGATDPY